MCPLGLNTGCMTLKKLCKLFYSQLAHLPNGPSAPVSKDELQGKKSGGWCFLSIYWAASTTTGAGFREDERDDEHKVLMAFGL